MWLLPFVIVSTAVLLSVPVGRYLAWLTDGTYKPPGLFRWFERQLDTGPQSWKQYAVSLLLWKAQRNCPAQGLQPARRTLAQCLCSQSVRLAKHGSAQL